MADKSKLEAEMAARAAAVSQQVREALQSSLPVAPEQMMTVQIPGTVINAKEKGPYWFNPKEHAETPHRIKVHEARLVDGMVPLSKIMMGPTGKSVARSYAAALDMLIPEDAPIDMDTSTVAKSKAAERYLAAMKYLTSTVPNSSKTVVDVYVEKQQIWSDAMKDWDRAKNAARDEAKRMYPQEIEKQQWHYDEWNQANFRNYKNHAQAKYMDWIVNGCKYKVDYNFGIVDVSSAMKRVESSKEASRNLVVIDPDGTTEWQEVTLEPSDWADICLEKVRTWNKDNNILSRKDYESEIKRVRRLLLSYEGLQSSIGGPLTEEELKDIGKTDAVSTTNKEEPTEEEKELSAAYQALYKAQAEPSKTPESAAALKEAQVRLQEALDKQGQANLQKNKDNVRDMDNMGRKEKRLWISKMIGDAKDQIDLLQKGLDRLSKSSIAVPAIQEVSKSESDGKELMTTNYSTADERWADPRFKLPRDGAAPPAPPKEDDKPSPWTKINVSISASSSESNKESQSSSSSVSASVSVGLFSASGGFNYSQASSKASESAASCNVDISFDAMLVTINRAWLHGELFADPELNVAPDVALSPGPSELHRFINNKEQKPLEKFSYFPSYPTSFVIASNVELEFRGDTTHLEQAVESSHFDANLKVGYGPFSLSASHSQDKSSSKTKMETTATGTRIKIEAPSIIGWVTTMLPKLPREKESNSLVQAFF